MSSFTDRYGREALALLQLDSAASEPLVGDDFPACMYALGPAGSIAELLAAEDYGTEDDDAYWRELQLHQLAEGGGCDYDEYDPANWIHRPADANPPAGTRFPGPAERLQHDFDEIVGTVRPIPPSLRR
jgi:hypothetical protein